MVATSTSYRFPFIYLFAYLFIESYANGGPCCRRCVSAQEPVLAVAAAREKLCGQRPMRQRVELYQQLWPV